MIDGRAKRRSFRPLEIRDGDFAANRRCSGNHGGRWGQPGTASNLPHPPAAEPSAPGTAQPAGWKASPINPAAPRVMSSFRREPSNDVFDRRAARPERPMARQRTASAACWFPLPPEKLRPSTIRCHGGRPGARTRRPTRGRNAAIRFHPERRPPEPFHAPAVKKTKKTEPSFIDMIESQSTNGLGPLSVAAVVSSYGILAVEDETRPAELWNVTRS